MLAGLFFLFSCGNAPEAWKNKSSADTASGRKAISVPVFQMDSAYSYIAAQLAFGPRVPGSPAHQKCSDYLVSRFKMWAPEVSVQHFGMQAFDGKTLKGQNIIASWKPEVKNRILLCAHWESRPWADHDPDKKNRRKPVEAADDGASGVGVLMEVARQFSIQSPEIGVDIVLFDLEDYGPPQDQRSGADDNWWGLGSQYWAQNPHREGYSARYGILLDMVGASNATFTQEGFSRDNAGDIQKKIWDAANRIGYGSYFLYESGGYVTDDHIFIMKYMNFPVVDIIHLTKTTDSGFPAHWHTLSDNLKVIDANTLKAVGQSVLTVVYEEE